MITPDDLAACQDDQLGAMWDRCIIRDADTYVGEVLTAGPVAWSYLGHDEIPCRVAVDDTQARIIPAGDQDLTVVRIIVTLPIVIVPVTNQVITIVSALIDPGLAGRRFDVTYNDFSTFITARRTHCIEHK